MPSREDVPDDRIQRDQVQVRRGRAGVANSREDLRQGEQARPGVEAERAGRGPALVPAELAADRVGPLEDGRPVPGGGEPGGGGETAARRRR